MNEYLKSIISDGTLYFCSERKAWHWDERIVHMQVNARGVSSLLTTNFNRLPPQVMKTVSVVSCFGSQIDESIINALNADNQVVPFDMIEQLKLAVQAGIMEQKAQHYQFTHDQVRFILSNDFLPLAEVLIYLQCL